MTDQRDYEKELKTPASLRSDRVATSLGTRWRLPSELHGGISGIGRIPMKFTDIEINIIIESLRMGEPLPKKFKERLLFQSDKNMADEGPIYENRYSGMTLYKAREKLEKDLILQALSKHANIITKASKELGITRPTLYFLMEKLKIPKPNPGAKVYRK